MMKHVWVVVFPDGSSLDYQATFKTLEKAIRWIEVQEGRQDKPIRFYKDSQLSAVTYKASRGDSGYWICKEDVA